MFLLVIVELEGGSGRTAEGESCADFEEMTCYVLLGSRVQAQELMRLGAKGLQKLWKGYRHVAWARSRLKYGSCSL